MRGILRVNRPRRVVEQKRRRDKLIGKTTWFRKLPGTQLNSLEPDPDAEAAPQAEAPPEPRPPLPPVPGSSAHRGPGTQHEGGAPQIPVEAAVDAQCPPKPPQPTEAVFFVPCTPNSLLKKMVQKAEETFCSLYNEPKVEVVERGGGVQTEASPPVTQSHQRPTLWERRLLHLHGRRPTKTKARKDVFLRMWSIS